MENSITPKTITIQEFQSYRNYKVMPIEGLNIPHITVTPNLVSKKRATEANDTIAVNIRFLFNSLTQDNLPQIKEQLRIILSRAQNAKMLEEVAVEILENFIMSEQHIKNYMHLLNAVSKACVLLTPAQTSNENTIISNKDSVTPTIGYYFLEKCREMIMSLISEDNIKKLAMLDQYDDDDLDKFNRAREKINNIIVTICCLYDQRHTSNIKLSAFQLYPLINNSIIEKYVKTRQMLGEIDEDHDEYETYRKMCNLYAEQVYVFLEKNGKDFVKEPPITIRDKTYSMKDLITRFKTEIMPYLTEAFLISKCRDLECMKD